MKSRHYSLLAVVSVVFFFACSGLGKMVKKSETITYEVTPNPLEVHGDSIAVTVSGKFIEKYFNKKATLTVTPVIRYGDQEVKLKAVTLKGEAVETEGQKINVAGGSFNYSDKIPYAKGMEESALLITANATIKTKTQPLPETEIAKGAIITSKMKQNDEEVASGKDNFTKTKPISTQASLNYAINNSTINESKLKKEEIKTLKEFIQNAQKSTDIKVKKINISSYASPDGDVELNDNLANNRGTSSSKWMEKELRKMKLEFQADTLLATSPRGEDWEGFKELMEASNIEDKDLILRVLSMYTDPNVREKEIKNISATYKVITDKILPELRRSKVIIDGEKLSYSDSVIIAFAKTNPDTLPLEDMHYALTLIDDLDVHENLMKAASNQYPNDWRGPNNLGVVYFKKGNNSLAKAEFTKAASIDNKQMAIKNNLGVIAYKEGDKETAKNYFETASSSIPEAKYNLGNLALEEGQYPNAMSYYGSSCSFNVALTKVLTNDYDGALTTISKCLEIKMTAEAYYLKAIIGARKNDQALLSESLKKSIELNSSFKEKAKKDLEFLKYKDSPDFTSIVQ